MTRQRFAVFTYGHGDTVFSTRFRFVARLVVRFVRTLEFLPDPLPEGMARGTAAAAGLVAPEGMEATLDETFWTWWPTARGEAVSVSVTSCKFCESPAMLLTERFEPVCASHYDSPTNEDQDEDQDEARPAGARSTSRRASSAS